MTATCSCAPSERQPVTNSHGVHCARCGYWIMDANAGVADTPPQQTMCACGHARSAHAMPTLRRRRMPCHRCACNSFVLPTTGAEHA